MIISISAAANEPGSPTKSYLYRLSKKENRPKFFVIHEGVCKIDIRKKSWKKYINADRKGTPKNPENNLKPKKKKQTVKKKTTKKKVVTPDTDFPIDEELEQLINKARIAKLQKPILQAEKMKYGIEQEKLKIQREAKELIEYEMADFLFFGYMEKINLEFLGLPKKIAPIIDNLVKEKKTDEILKRLKREFETILLEIKKAQAKDLENWRNEK